MAANFHERFSRPELPLPSDRSTAFVFTAVTLIAAYFLRASPIALWIALGIAAIFALLGTIAPSVIRPLNVAWMRFALLLNKIMNPVVMLLLFAVVIVPAGLIMQCLRDPLRRRRRPAGTSYWIERRRDERASMSNQF